jgi:transposase
MDQPTIVGLDLAKNVFQVHGVDAAGTVVVRRQLRRTRVVLFLSRLAPCLVGMEACSGAHHWARELTRLGHEVRLMPPAYVKRGKTDRADAEAIAEAVTRPTMRFVPIKSAERQAALLDHKARDFLVRQQTQTVNSIRAHLSEFGIVVAKDIRNVGRVLDAAHDAPKTARPALDLLADQRRDLSARIDTFTGRIGAALAEDALARRLATVPGVGPIASGAIAATTPDVGAFRTTRDHAAWLGLTPKPHSSGGKERLGRISKAGNRHLRRLLHLGAMAQIGARRRGRPSSDWLWSMLQKKPAKAVAIALANRMARIVWAPIRTGESHRPAAARDDETTARDGGPETAEARREVMAAGRRHDDWDTLFEPEHLRVRAIDWDLDAGGLHQGAQPAGCILDAGYMAATDRTSDSHETLAQREPSIHGPRTMARATSAFSEVRRGLRKPGKCGPCRCFGARRFNAPSRVLSSRSRWPLRPFSRPSPGPQRPAPTRPSTSCSMRSCDAASATARGRTPSSAFAEDRSGACRSRSSGASSVRG